MVIQAIAPEDRYVADVPIYRVPTYRGAVGSVVLVVKTGARYEPPRLRGVTHLLEHALIDGRSRAGAKSAGEKLERLGGEVNAVTSHEYAAFHYRGPSAHLGDAAPILVDAVLRPSISRESWTSAQRVVAEELRSTAADPFEAVKDAFSRQVFPVETLGLAIGGSLRSVRTIERAPALAYHQDRFHVGQAAMLFAGDFDAAILSHAVERCHLDTLPRGSWSPPEPSPPVSRPVATVARDGSGDDTYMMIGGRGASYSDERRVAYEVLSALVASSTASTLYSELRSKTGYAYYLDSWHTPYTDTGLWRVHIGCATRRADRVARIVESSLVSLSKRVLPQQLHAAKRTAAARALRALEGSAELALETGKNRWIGGSPDWDLVGHTQRLMTVRSKDIYSILHDLLTRGLARAVAVR